MFKFILKKLLFMIPMLLVISFLIFFALKSMPIDPINYLLPPEASQDATLKEQLREAYGLNKPFLVQYGNWIGNILKGDFGYSILNGQPIKEILKQKLPATLQLATTALVISSVLGILLGILSAVNQNSIIDYIGRVIGVLGQSIPQFLFGIILITVFALQLKILPAGGRNLYGKNDLLSQFKAIILPACALSIGMIATVLRYTRNSMLDVINKEYIKTARSKGVPENKVYSRHIFRNSILPIAAFFGYSITGLLGGSIFIEKIFSYPGMGGLFVNSIITRDYSVVTALILLFGFLTLLGSLLSDIILSIVDPRIRIE